jgi:hypothetical protein
MCIGNLLELFVRAASGSLMLSNREKGKGKKPAFIRD